MAIGLSLKKKDIKKFKEKLEKYVEEKNIEDLKPEILIDTVITSENTSINEIDEIKKLEPFGEGNAMPIILYKNLKIVAIRTLSEGKHLKLMLADGNTYIDAIGFNMGEYANKYQIGDKIDVVGNITVNRFKDLENIQVVLKDLRVSVE